MLTGDAGVCAGVDQNGVLAFFVHLDRRLTRLALHGEQAAGVGARLIKHTAQKFTVAADTAGKYRLSARPRGGYRLVEALAAGKLIQLPDRERFTRSDYAPDGINKVDVARTENKNLQNDRSF